MSEPTQRVVTIAGGPCRIWEKGEGEVLGVVHGLGGFPRWTPFLEALSHSRRLIVPSLPGFPGAGDQHRILDGHLDWLAATLDLLEACGLEGADLAAASVGAMLVADVAALAPGFARRLVLAAPYGLFDVNDPGVNVFASTPEEIAALQSAQLERYEEVVRGPDDPEGSAEWQLRLYRAAEAAARIAWPFGERGLSKRLHRIRVPVLLLWGEEDQVIPPSYAKRFAAGLGGAVETQVLPGAGHQVWIDAPDTSAAAIARFLDA